jgi:hypothetical protein
LADVRTLKLNLLADVDQFGKSLNKADNDTKGFSKNLTKYGKMMAAAFVAAGAAAAAMAVKFGLDAVQAASDLNEEISKTNVIFGETSKEIIAFSKTADKSFGLTQKEALNASSTFAILGKNAGLTGKELTKFSISSTKLASDLGSFYNTKAEDAILAIGSAMRGEAEPIRKYGVLISAAALDEAAFNYELRTGVELERDKKNQLTETSKVLARYQAILDQTTDAQGDFSRTSEGLAAQQKILTASLENLKVTMGQNLLPMMLSVVSTAGDIAKGFGGDDPQGLSARARELAGTFEGDGAYSLGASLRAVADAFGKLYSVITKDGDEASTTLQDFANAMQSVANGINAIANAYNKGVKALQFIGRVDERVQDFLGIPESARGPMARAAGGPVMAGGAYRVGEFGPEMFVPSGSGSIRPDNSGQGVTIIMNGVIDGESARRSIERLLQDSSRRTGAINLVGATL